MNTETTEIVLNEDYYINLYQSKPEGAWCTEKQRNDKGQKCAIGFISTWYTEEAHEDAISTLRTLFDMPVTCSEWSYANPYRPGQSYTGITAIAAINNGHTLEYQQPTPKQRILAAFNDLKAYHLAKKN